MQTIDPDNSSTPDNLVISEETVAPAVVQNQVAEARAIELGCFLPGYLVGGSYEVIDLLGSGGMGRVYRAKHVSMPAIYALKVLITDQLNDNKVMRFQNEAQAIAKLNHPNIIAIYNFGLHDGRLPFYVMELLDGENLHNILLRDGPAPVSVALPIFIEVAAGLGHAHRKGILHRDVKPANIVLLAEPDARGARVKLVDFGIVKFAEEIRPDIQKLTALGAVCGSPSYMSPEQATGGKTDPRSDIYSLGCTLFQTLTGKVPFHGRNSTETMMMHYERAAPTLAGMGAGRTYSEDLELLLAKLLAKQPMDRYQTMDAVAQDMRNILEDKPLGTPAPLPQTAPVISRNSATGSYAAATGSRAAATGSRAAATGSHSAATGSDAPATGSDAAASGQSHGAGDGRSAPVSARATAHDINLMAQSSSAQPAPTVLPGPAPAAVPETTASEDLQTDEASVEIEGSGEFTSSERKIFDPLSLGSAPGLALVALLTICLLGTVAFFTWQALQPLKPIVVSGDANSLHPGGGVVSSSSVHSAAAPAGMHASELQNPDAGGPADLEVSAPVELTKAKYFSTTILMNGREYLQFDFPKQTRGEALAWVFSSLGDSQRAQGKVLIVKGPSIYLIPSAGAIRVPQFFEKFRPGEIAGFILAPTTESDELFIDACKIPGVSQVGLSRCTKLTDKIMPSLSKLNLTILSAPGLTLDSETLAKAHFWQNLKTLMLSKCKNLTPILKKIAGSKKLETLDLADTKLGAEDYQLIARLPNLKALNITSNKVTAEDLRVLSHLRHLDTLSLVYLRFTGGSLADQLKQFSALKNLVVVKNFFRPAELQKLQQECPKLRIKQFGPDDIAKMSRGGLQDHW